MYQYASKGKMKSEKFKFKTRNCASHPTQTVPITHSFLQMKERVRNPSSFSFDDARVHDNPDKPARLQMLAYTRETPPFAGPGPAVQQKHRMASNAAGVVQRSIGFEFQTGWNLQVDKAWIFTTRDSEQRFCLKKGTPVFTDNNYTLEADDCDKKMSELEFVTAPLSSREDVATVIENMTTTGRRWIEQYPNIKQWYPLHGSKKYWIRPYDRVLSANPQVTFGLGLDRIAALKNGDADVHQTTHLDGLVALIKSYMGKNFQKRKELIYYPKMITDAFLLARTDFVNLYRLAIRNDDIDNMTEEEWLGRFAEYDLDQCLFPKIHDTTTCTEYVPPLTRRLWLVDMRKKWFAKDQLTKIRDSESMGKLGSKKDTLHDGNQAGIFEYRRVQTIRKNINDWRAFALEWYDRIKALGALP